ncbi:transporter [Frankia sp. AgB1.9]|uniref:thiolase C-terminal domain-containing protein n=1 Tax=unclassified Frankia TaxID=2632575 RepID=UPI001931BE30|nr:MULTISPECIES: transporter [unclassified Frankia]MBL7487642.1 transporter [Frankia sp. AgW1.1]MBL7550020.1 transporter [Frankia sp. AgB1.9]MBL7621915.1 transporter [Frankia sp. AgB1.8]
MPTERERGFRGAAAVVGVGETEFYRRGTSPYSGMQLAAMAVMRACEDAGVSPTAVDGFSSYAHDSNEGLRLGANLGVEEIRFSQLVFGGGGGGVAAAVNAAAAAVASGQAECVAVYRSLTQADDGRGSYVQHHLGPLYTAHGLFTAAQICALRTQRMLEVDGVPAEAMAAVALAGYHHAQRNPRAIAHGQPLTAGTYSDSRWVSSPLRLFDCSRENDGAAALLVVPAEHVERYRGRPAYILAGVQGSGRGWSESLENETAYTSAGFHPAMVERLWAAAGIGPDDVEVVQLYENFTGPAVASMIDFGLCEPGPAAVKALHLDNLIVDGGGLPINTAGGNLAEGFVHGINLALEAVRQLRGGSPNPVTGAGVSLLVGGPAAPLVSATVFGATPGT